MNKRVKYCDMLRFIAIICIIVIHTFADFRDYYLANNKIYYYLLTFADSFTRIGVPLFFMLTGAFMLSKKINTPYFTFIRKRIPKLFIPFFIISIIYYISSKYLYNTDISIKNFLINFTSPGGVHYHFWFMYMIIMIYLLLPYINKAVRRLSKKDLETIITLIIIFGSTVTTINKLTLRYNIELLGGFKYPELIIAINFLLIGYYLYNNNISTKNKKLIYVLACVSLLLMPLIDYCIVQDKRNDFIFAFSSVFCVFPSIAAFILCKDNYNKISIPQKVEKFISKVGQLGIYIYLVHVLVLEVLKRNIYRFIHPIRFTQNIMTIIILNILVFIISYFVAIIMDFIYNKIHKLITKQD